MKVSDFDTLRTDPVRFIDTFLSLNEKGEQWTLSPHQRRILALTLRFVDGHLYQLRYLIWSEVKKSGKTLLAAALIIWWAYTRRSTTVIVVANDERQAVGRVFKTVVALIEHNRRLASSATVRAMWIELSNRTRIEAIPLDYQGESGGRQSLVSYDEPWGVMTERARRLFEELTPIPSERESWVLMTTTAGFTGESELLESLYLVGLQGERLDPELEVNRAGSVTMFWSHVPRQPWLTKEYYDEQRVTLRPNAFRRLHENQWVTGTEAFITGDEWDACVDGNLIPAIGTPKDDTVYGVDVGIKHDTSAVVGVSMRGDLVRLVSHRIWRPTPEEPIDLEETVERYLVERHRLGRMAAVVCDPYQFHRSLTTLQKGGLPIRELPQTVANTTAFSQTLYDVIKGRNLRAYPAADMREQILNAVAVENARGWRLAKEKTSRKIDVVVALAMAVHEAIEQGKRDTGPAVAVVMPSASRADNADWQDRFYGIRRPPSAITKLGLIEAPRRWETSDAMRVARAEDEREEERSQRLARARADHQRTLADAAKQEQAERDRQGRARVMGRIDDID